MLKMNKKLSKKGFSLIELMVAVVILAIVSFGIFLAFSTGFQTMNDAKDRTIATNYAQQILEDYKNSHFEKIKPFSDSIEGVKFTQNVDVQIVDGNANLKNVMVQISWIDRNNNQKNVSVSTLIYDTQTIAEIDSTPRGIFIYANPYNLLPGTDERAVPSEIFAEIVDGNGNLVTDWNESNVNFSIESVVNLENEYRALSYLGSLSITSDLPVQGVAETTFNQWTGEEREGYVQIKVSLNVDGVGEIYDTLTLKVTNEAVAIVLTSDKEIIRTEGGEEGTANLTATIVDAVGDTVVTDRVINFNIFSGPGNLTNLMPTSDGLAYIDLISGTTAGVATLMATSNLLEPGSINIEIVDPGANYITVEADDQTIVQQGSAVITAYLTDYLRNPIEGETIAFSRDNGELSSPSDTTGEDGSAIVTLTMNYAGTATVMASWTAEDDSVISDTVEVLCRNHNLYVSADPIIITEGSTTTISAELTNRDGYYVVGETINFNIIEGNGSLFTNSATTDEYGVAMVVLSISSPGTTTVEASWSGDPTIVTGEAEIICTSAPVYVVELSTESTTISVGGTLTITATVTEGISPVAIGTEVTFSLDDYTNAKLDNQSSSVIAFTDIDGIASVILSDLTAGEEVTVTAEVEDASDDITITCEAPTISIALADSANIKHPQYWHGGQWVTSNDEISFDIIITGGSVDLDKMIVSWEPDNGAELNRVYIDGNELYKNNQGADNGTTIFFNRGSYYYTIEDGNVYTFVIWFDSNVIDKSWTITFLDPDTEEEISTIEFYLD